MKKIKIPSSWGDRSPLALVTGASGGLGRELSLKLAEAGFSLILSGRELGKLSSLASAVEAAGWPRPEVFACDLLTEGALEALVGFCQTHGAVDVLVNNAGFGHSGPFTLQEERSIRDLLALDIQALTLLTRAFLPSMTARRQGAVLQVASVGAYLPGPLMAVYYAAKAYVLSFSLAVREEVRESGVSVTALCPASLDTGFHARAGSAGVRMRFKAQWTSPEKAAEEGLLALFQNRPAVTPGWQNRAALALMRLLPRTWAAALFKALQ